MSKWAKFNVKLTYKLRPNRNACRVPDFENFGQQKHFIIPIQKYYNIFKNWAKKKTNLNTKKRADNSLKGTSPVDKVC